MSKAALTSVVTKLRLEPGDVIVVRDFEVLQALEHIKLPNPFQVPLIFAPSGIDKLKRADLLNILEQLDAAVHSEPPASVESTVPL